MDVPAAVHGALSILEEEDRQTLTFYICLLMAVVGLIYGALTATLQLRSILTNFGIIALIAFLNNVCATVFLQYGVQYAGAGLCAILSVFEPLGSIVIGAILLHEQLTLRQMLSCVLILGSICFLIVKQRPPGKSCGPHGIEKNTKHRRGGRTCAPAVAVLLYLERMTGGHVCIPARNFMQFPRNCTKQHAVRWIFRMRDYNENRKNFGRFIHGQA